MARLPQNVRLLDDLPGGEVLDRISRCRLVLLPSRTGRLPRVLVEAVCGGKAIVTSGEAAHLDCLCGSDGTAGGLGWNENGFAGNSIDELAAAVERLSDDGRLLDRMQSASSRWAAEHFDWDHCRRQWEAFYEGGDSEAIARTAAAQAPRPWANARPREALVG